MNICVLGAGYVGLVTGACLAELGQEVKCVDPDKVRIQGLNSGIMPIYEPGLSVMVNSNCQAGRLKFTTDIRAGLAAADICFICVGTPPAADGSADLTQFFAAVRDIGRAITKELLVVDKSTVPVGTADQVRLRLTEHLAARGLDIDFTVASNPEFLREGEAINDFMFPDRIIIGTDNEEAAAKLVRLYQPVVKDEKKILLMDCKSAEISKYAANAMLAVRISFINEIALLCDRAGGDVAKVRDGIGTDRRIGEHFLAAGIGYGGSCFPKDVKELISLGRKHRVAMAISRATEQVNARQKGYLTYLIKRRFGHRLRGLKFAVWGLAFKPHTDDMREAPALVIIKTLLRAGARVAVFDPAVPRERAGVVRKYSSRLVYGSDMMTINDQADALIIVTEWPQFSEPDFTDLKRRLAKPVIFDGRNLYDPDRLARLGIEYYCVGRNRYAG